jgi:hypothetical protein
MTPDQMSYFGYGIFVGACIVVLIGILHDLVRGKP